MKRSPVVKIALFVVAIWFLEQFLVLRLGDAGAELCGVEPSAVSAELFTLIFNYALAGVHVVPLAFRARLVSLDRVVAHATDGDLGLGLTGVESVDH